MTWAVPIYYFRTRIKVIFCSSWTSVLFHVLPCSYPLFTTLIYRDIINNGPGKRWISKIVNPTRVISPRANPSGVDNFGYSPIQRAVTVSLYRTNSWNILCNIWIVKVLFQVFTHNGSLGLFPGRCNFLGLFTVE